MTVIDTSSKESHRFSSVVHPSLYIGPTYGLCEGLEVRLHNENELDDLGVLMAQQAWRGTVQKCAHTSLSRVGNIVSLCFPNCRPERLEILAYLWELGFIQDDMVDTGAWMKSEVC